MAFETLKYILGLEGNEKFKRQYADVRKTVDKESKGIVSLFGSLATAAKTFIAGAVVQQVTRAIISLGNMAEKTRVVGTSFERLASAAKLSSTELLSAMRRGSEGTISNLEMMQKANQALLLGIPVTAQQMEELSQVALRLGRAVGRGPTEALGDLITGFGRMSPLILDNLGLTIKAEEAYTKYATSLGKTAEQLTEAERKTAFFAEGMRVARQRAKELGDVSGGLTEKWAKVSAQWEDVQVKAGEMLLPWLESALSLLGGIVTAAGAATDGLNNLARTQGAVSQRPPGAGVISEAAAAAPGAFRFLPGSSRPAGEQQAKTREELFDEILGTATASRAEAKLTAEQMQMRNFIYAAEDAKKAADEAKKAADEAAKAEAKKQAIYGTRTPGRAAAARRMEITGYAMPSEAAGVEGGRNPWDFTESEIVDMHDQAARIAQETGKEFVDVYDKIQSEAAERMGREWGNIPNKMEANFLNSLSRVEASLQAIGLKGTGIFGGISNIYSGMLGLGFDKKMKDSGGEFGKMFMGVLNKAGFAGQLAGGILSAGKTLISGLSSLFQSLDSQMKAKSDAELLSAVNMDTSGYGGWFKKDVAAAAQKELDRRTLSNTIASGAQQNVQSLLTAAGIDVSQYGASSGSQAFGSVATITESQSNAMLSVLETQRAQDAERNAILERMDGRLGNIEWATTVSAGTNLMRAQGL